MCRYEFRGIPGVHINPFHDLHLSLWHDLFPKLARHRIRMLKEYTILMSQLLTRQVKGRVNADIQPHQKCLLVNRFLALLSLRGLTIKKASRPKKRS